MCVYVCVYDKTKLPLTYRVTGILSNQICCFSPQGSIVILDTFFFTNLRIADDAKFKHFVIFVDIVKGFILVL